MRYFSRFIITLGLLCCLPAQAAEFYAEFLYWQPSETIDWALTNNLSLPNQVITYKTIDFHSAPGLRVGMSLQREGWQGRLLYTWFNTNERASVTGNVVSAFMPSRFATTFYQSGQVNFKIHFNTLDADLYKKVPMGEPFLWNPLIGIKAAWINQSVDTLYQGGISVLERVNNNFSGLGPKIGVETRWLLFKRENFHYALLADFSTAFLWGRWSINDTMTQSNASALSSVNIANRTLGAFEVQGFVGLSFTHHDYSLSVGYEISDWFNQYQLFDNATGTHSNDLILQGLTLIFKKNFL